MDDNTHQWKAQMYKQDVLYGHSSTIFAQVEQVNAVSEVTI